VPVDHRHLEIKLTRYPFFLAHALPPLCLRSPQSIEFRNPPSAVRNPQFPYSLRMSSEKATALVLRVVEFSETSSIVTLFTREFGKVRGLAKGARRPKSSFESALDLLSLCRIVFLRKSSDSLDLLTEAKLERRFRAAGRDLSSLYAAYYVAELLAELTDDGDPHPELFDAACQTLAALGALGSPVATVLLRFELNALRLLGHMPQLDACVECGREVNNEQRVAFGQLAGGVLCARCRPGKRQVVSMSAAALRLMKQLATAGSEGQSAGDRTNEIQTTENAPATDPQAPSDRRTVGELRGLVNHYMCNLLGHKPRMHAYLTHLAD